MQMFLIYMGAQFLPVLISVLFTSDESRASDIYYLVYGTVASFFLGAAGMIWLDRSKSYKTGVELEDRAPDGSPILWGIIGLFMALFAQYIASIIEITHLGIPAESANTQSLVLITEQFPIFLVGIAIFVPIMQEYIFSKVIFGSLYPYTGVIGAAVISSLIFAFIHMDGHLLVYSSMGFVFSYLYY